MNNLTDVVKQLIIINVLLYVATHLPVTAFLQRYLTLYIPTSEHFKPIQLVTHMFMHADIGHLFFNMLGLFFFGPWLEKLWGAKKFLFFYLFCGIGAMLAHMMIGFDYDSPVLQSVLGASGAVYGIVLGFGMLFPNVKVMLLFPPIPLKAKYMALMYIGYDLYMGLSGSMSTTAHFAHLGGALFGFLLIIFWRKFPSQM